MVDGAVARIENAAVRVVQAIALHAPEQSQAHYMGALLLAGTFRANEFRRRIVALLFKAFHKSRGIDVVLLRKQEPRRRIAVVVLSLPETRGRGFGIGARRPKGGEQK